MSRNTLPPQAKVHVSTHHANVIEGMGVSGERCHVLKSDDFAIGLTNCDMKDSSLWKFCNEVTLGFDGEGGIEGREYPRFDDRIQNAENGVDVVRPRFSNGYIHVSH